MADVKKQENPEDPMLQRVTKYIPRQSGSDQQNVYVGINGKGYNIPCGKNVEMPLPVWLVIERALQAEAKYDADVRDASVHIV